jgi:hypothetical protein
MPESSVRWMYTVKPGCVGAAIKATSCARAEAFRRTSWGGIPLWEEEVAGAVCFEVAVRMLGTWQRRFESLFQNSGEFGGARHPAASQVNEIRLESSQVLAD